MLIILQFPLSDVRGFVELPPPRIEHPDWEDPIANREFVRSFGVVRQRRRGGLTGWVGENDICVAARALRVPKTSASQALFRQPGWRIVSRTLYVDKYAASKFEIGFMRNAPITTGVPLRKTLQALLDLPVRVPTGTTGAPVTTRLGDAGRHLAMLYLRSTTRHAAQEMLAQNAWWVQAGSPSFLIAQHEGETDPIGLDSKGIFPPSKYGPQLTFYQLGYGDAQHSIWAFRADARENTDEEYRRQLRKLRIAVLRIHAERESLDNVLRQARQGRLVSDLSGDAGGRLQDYLNEATRRIGKLEQRTSVTMAALATALEGEEEAPAVWDAFKAAIRPTVRKKVEQLIARAANQGDAPAPTLTGAQVGALQAALLDAFDRLALAQMLRVQMEADLDVVAGNGPLQDVVFTLIQWAERTGRTAELVAGARAANPGSVALQQVGDISCCG